MKVFNLLPLGVTNGLCEHLRVCEHCDFFASSSRDKKFALRAASNLESTTREQRALLIQEQDPRVRTASSGRILKPPNCFYRKHGLIKAQGLERQRNSEELKVTISSLCNHIQLNQLIYYLSLSLIACISTEHGSHIYRN